MSFSNQQREYLVERVRTGSPLELVRILYESALQGVGEALVSLRSGDILARGHAITRTIQILAELQGALRHDVNKEYSETLARLYTYMRGQLIRAQAEKSEEPLLEVSRLLQTLLEGWVGAMENMNSGFDPSAATATDSNASSPSDNNPYSDQPVPTGSRGRSWQL